MDICLVWFPALNLFSFHNTPLFPVEPPFSTPVAQEELTPPRLSMGMESTLSWQAEH